MGIYRLELEGTALKWNFSFKRKIKRLNDFNNFDLVNLDLKFIKLNDLQYIQRAGNYIALSKKEYQAAN